MEKDGAAFARIISFSPGQRPLLSTSPASQAKVFCLTVLYKTVLYTSLVYLYFNSVLVLNILRLRLGYVVGPLSQYRLSFSKD